MRHRPLRLPTRPSTRLLLATLWLLVVLGVGVFAAAPAAAHATLVETDPANDLVIPTVPPEVALRFDAAVRAEPDAVRILGPDGGRVEGRTTTGERGLRVTTDLDDGGRGTYTVSWRVLSEDGHTITGSFVFHVGERTGSVASVDEGVSPAVGLLGWIGRSVEYVAAAGLLAGAVVMARAATGRRPPGWWWPSLGVALGLAAIATLLSRAAAYSGRPLLEAVGRVPSVLTAGRPGIVLGLRVLAFLVAAVSVLLPASRRRPALWAGAAAAGLAVGPLGGHPATASPAAVAVVMNAAHVLGAALWVGGLLTLLAAAITARTPEGSGDEEPTVEPVVRSVSTLAVAAAPVVVLTGTVAGWWWSRSAAALTGTPYGRLVLAKAAGTVLLLVLGWWHRRRLVDVLGRWLGTLRIEALAGVALFGVAAALVNMPPAVDQQAQPFRGVSQAGDVVVVLNVEPGRRGANDLHLYFQDVDGQLRGVDAAEVRVGADGVPARKVPIVNVAAGHAVAPGVALTAPGRWGVEVSVIQRGRPGSTTFEVPIP